MSEQAKQHANTLLEYCLKAVEPVSLRDAVLKADEEQEKDEHGCVVGKEVWNEETGKCVLKPVEPEAEEKANPFDAKLKALETGSKPDTEQSLEAYQKSILKDLHG